MEVTPDVIIRGGVQLPMCLRTGIVHRLARFADMGMFVGGG